MGRNYRNFLDKGFYKRYDDSVKRQNLFFVFQHGTSTRAKFDEQKINSLKSILLNNVDYAYKISVANEKGLIKELISALSDDNGQIQSLWDYIGADPNYSDVSEIIKKGGATTQDEIATFFNSRYFNTSGMAKGNVGDTIMANRGEEKASDTFWRKLYQDCWGLVTAASKKTTLKEARSAMKKKWRDYAYKNKSNTWSTVGGYFGSLGDMFKETGLEEEFLDSMIGAISKNEMTAEQVRAIISSGKRVDFKVKSSNDNKAIMQHGTYQELLVDLFNKFFLPQLYGPVGVNMTLKRTGSDTREYSSVEFKDGGIKRGTTINTGQTDIMMDFDFSQRGKPINYKVNVSAKMNQGFKRIENAAKRTVRFSDEKTNYDVSVYGGGTLRAAIDRIYSSPVFSENGMLTEDNFIDLAYLLINAAQGGISDKEDAIEAYRAVISFVGMEEIGEGVNLDAEGNLVNLDGQPISQGIVNLFMINGVYIPASTFFLKLKEYLEEEGAKGMKTSIAFANTFQNSMSTDVASYARGYFNFINENGLNADNGEGKTYIQNIGDTSRFFKGDPAKIRSYILANTKAKSFTLNWQNFWKSLIEK